MLISYIGYRELRVEVGDRTTFDLEWKSSNKLDQVVIRGTAKYQRLDYWRQWKVTAAGDDETRSGDETLCWHCKAR